MPPVQEFIVEIVSSGINMSRPHGSLTDLFHDIDQKLLAFEYQIPGLGQLTDSKELRKRKMVNYKGGNEFVGN